MSQESTLEARDLRLIQAIVEEGSVTRAARRLYLSQSAISHQLSGLETRLGVTLFERVRKRMVITPAGQRLAALAAEVLPRLAREQALLRAALTPTPPRPLRLAAQCYTCYQWLPRLLTGLSTAHPEVDLRLDVEATRSAEAALLEDRLDVALCCYPVSTPGLVSTPLFRDELVAVLPAGHPLAARPYVSGPDLTEQAVYFYPLPAEDEERFRRELLPRRPDALRVRTLPLTEAMVELVRSGHGVSLIARWSLGPHLAQGGLVTRGLGRKGYWRQWSAVHKRHSPLAPALATLVDLLRSAVLSA
ncbi:transcriptional activator, LysR family [Myxococcus xanthus DK 1622]|uniref:Transcriptional activator, LysR family n=1 Tax=Myxococcus xanthus (strain DK1622) TaxID=246197 RepID=Q1DAH1_MYXXD|nr:MULTISPECIES: LysR family transcriptional regulator [Myxococcus]ABF90007.1 transcriptional activator, LysR family [Myxococcus xanthus DK 1622]NOJ56580.1 LysR family transcriptional regulator [Myxococcus xanthus]QPM81678.1 LysR family transcriptional regulator [Myxococcus xanthus]QVW70929.1 LysR family transcriptional regulator [Myxococcus xanthus DZ2]QZZ49859.1 HTH-type transcriptional regulator MetR [Myxococcus xanthus]